VQYVLLYGSIDAPPLLNKGGRQATARAQVGGGKVLAVFMTDKGAGYRSSIQVTPADSEPDPPIIQPFLDADKPGAPLKKGLAKVTTGGAGWKRKPQDKAPTVTVRGTGSGAKAEIVQPGEIIRVGDSGIGGFTSKGVYPSTGDLKKDAARIVVHVPPAPDGTAQKAKVALMQLNKGAEGWNGVYHATLITDPGAGYKAAPTQAKAKVKDRDITIPMSVNLLNGCVVSADPKGPLPDGCKPFEGPIEVTFTEPAHTREAKPLFIPAAASSP